MFIPGDMSIPESRVARVAINELLCMKNAGGQIAMNFSIRITYKQRFWQRGFYKIILKKTKMKFLAVLGKEEKTNKLPTTISMYATFRLVFFNLFRTFFSFQFFKKYFSIHTKKLHNIKLTKS